MISRIRVFVSIGAAVVLAASVAVAVTLAAPASASTRHHPCLNERRQLAAIYLVRRQLAPWRWRKILKAADVLATGQAYKVHLTPAERVLREDLHLDAVHIRRQCAGGV